MRVIFFLRGLMNFKEVFFLNKVLGRIVDNLLMLILYVIRYKLL